MQQENLSGRFMRNVTEKKKLKDWFVKRNKRQGNMPVFSKDCN